MSPSHDSAVSATAAVPPLAVELHLADEAATAALGRQLALGLQAQWPELEAQGAVITFRGDLGAGKTALIRALLRALGVTGSIKSPTFALLEPYPVSSLDFYHFDFYRLSASADFAAAGFREHFGAGCVDLVEWPERAGNALPVADLALALSFDGHGRRVTLRANSKRGSACLQPLIDAVLSGSLPGVAVCSPAPPEH
jgi:tRNA threonylcarbamoyladenosine biosynthesis protein TsaE